MVLAHQKFDFKDKCLIEKVSIKAPFRFAVDFQDEACFVYFAEGKAKINSPDGQTEISHQESVLLKCGSHFADLLKYSDADSFEVLVFHLYPNILRNIYQNEILAFMQPSKQKAFTRKVASDDVLRKFIESLYFYFDNPSLVSDELLELKVKELLLLLVQSKNAESVMALFSDLFTPRTSSVKEVVNSHIFSNLSIKDMAKLSNLSVSTFNRTFQNMFHDSPANYIKIKRLERAKELLAITSLTINEVAFQSGFNDIAHFSRSFRTFQQCSPTEYRLSLKADKN